MPRKTAKKPTTKKAAARKTAPKRKAYQTGGAAKTMRPGTMQSMPLATGQRMATAPARTSSQEAERKRQEMIRRDRAMMEVGNRQRAAAFEAARKRAAAQRQAQSMRQREQQLAAMRQQRTPARAQDLRNTPRKLSPAQQRLLDSYNRGMAQMRQQKNATPRPTAPRLTPQQLAAATQRQATPQKTPRARAVPTLDMNQARPVGQVLTPQELARLRANPNRPNMVNQVQNLSQAKAAERRRIQQQIAQLQARLRQLGG